MAVQACIARCDSSRGLPVVPVDPVDLILHIHNVERNNRSSNDALTSSAIINAKYDSPGIVTRLKECV